MLRPVVWTAVTTLSLSLALAVAGCGGAGPTAPAAPEPPVAAQSKISVDGGAKAVDKQVTPSGFAYNRLLDGLRAEEAGKLDEASKAYADATWKPVLPEGDTVAPEMREQLAIAVGALARFRNALLMMQSNTPPEIVNKVLSGTPPPFDGLGKAAVGAKSREAACAAAIAWVGAHPDFLKALNSPRGQANPQWQGPDLCGPLPNS